MEIIEITNWADFKSHVNDRNMPSWIYRGQADSSWPVLSSISRYYRDFNVHEKSWEFQEKRVLRIFKRKAHHFLNHLPDDEDSYEWLALMQHFGTPTRLIDFTFSPYVAAYFALSSSTNDCAVWALFPPVFDTEKEIELLDSEIINPKDLSLRIPGNYEEYLLPGSKTFVLQGEPERMNQRLIAQAGTFIIPSVLNKPIEDILLNYPDGISGIKKFILKKSIRDEAMLDLYRSNITEATLFPGIDGMAKSLSWELEFHWAYNPKSMKKKPGFDSPPFGLPKEVK